MRLVRSADECRRLARKTLSKEDRFRLEINPAWPPILISGTRISGQDAAADVRFDSAARQLNVLLQG